MDNILITHFKVDKNQTRNNEILDCIKSNLKLNFFDEARLLIEGGLTPEFSRELNNTKTDTKLTIESTSKRLTYKEIFKICNHEPNKTFYLTNADIVFNKSLRKMSDFEECLNSGVVLAQHRYNLIPGTDDIVFEKTPPISGEYYSGSADAFIFNTPIEFSHEFNFFGGTSYCDQHLSSLLSKSGRLCISISDIICEHRHASKINNDGTVQDEDYKCTTNNNCKDNLTNEDIKYNPILEADEVLFIFNSFQSIKDSNLKNLEFLCQTFLKHKHGTPGSIKKNPEQEILLEISKVRNTKISPEEFAKIIQPKQAFKWHGFPNPKFILESIFEHEK
jgi:hypothetical protein